MYLVGIDPFVGEEEACAEAPLGFALSSSDDLPCSGWLDIDAFSAILSCSKECTDTCKGIIDNVYAGCSAMDTSTSHDEMVSYRLPKK